MTEETKRCPFCAEEVLALARKCKHCGSDLDMVSRGEEVASSTSETSSPESMLNTNLPPWVPVIVLVAIAVLILFGNFHIITGKSFGLDIAHRDSFGFTEIFINVDAITGMPWFSAKSQFPLSCRVLQREGIIESDEAFKARAERKAKEKFDKAMQDAQKKIERSLYDLQW